MTSLIIAAALHGAVSQVTIYGDRARIERTADAPVDGTARVELPLLPDSIDSSSIRLAATGAEVQRIDVQHVAPDEFPMDEARKLLAQLDKLDDQIGAATGERWGVQQQIGDLQRIAPEVRDDPLKPRPKLNASGWAASTQFAQGELDKLRGRARDIEQRLIDLNDERRKVAEQARNVGGAGRRSGWRVTAQLAGHGTAHLSLTYLAANARWVPEYALQLQSDQKSVKVWFGGTASQETGEDWQDSVLTLSTAVPATARALPRIATWKIGEKERFVPTPVRRNPPMPPRPPPAPMPVDQPERESDRLRAALMAKAQETNVAVAAAPPPPPPAADMAGLAPPAQRQMAEKRRAVAGKPKSMPAQAAREAPAPMAALPLAGTGGPEQNPIIDGVPVGGGGLSPPAGFRPQPLPPDAPNMLAGGYDLEFASAHKESLKSGAGARRVSLFQESWPVKTERLIYPALSQDAYLVAQIRNPSQRTLPRGSAQLMLGDDPAGTAALPLMSPGEEVTLPLGIDRAIKPFRNVAQVQSEKGLFSKDDVTRYEVTIDVANPYGAALPMRVVDQLPLAGDKNVQIEDADLHGAEVEQGTGKLTWRLDAPPRGKAVVKYAFTLRRPKGYKVHQ